MFSELPKLFGREFAIGFLLPIAVFIPLAFLIADSFANVSIHGVLGSVQKMDSAPTLLGATIFVFFLWLGGVTLSALNRTIIRIKEGYGLWNPARIWGFIEKRRFAQRMEHLGELDKEFFVLKELSQAESLAALRRQRAVLLRELAVRFPDQEAYILPTAFGNTIRAFEVYSRIMYGIDSIPLWPRLLMIMSADARALIEAAKAEMDFWLNLWVVSIVLVVEYLVLAVLTENRGNLWILFILLIFMPLSSRRARVAAAEWGEMVKAAFDVHVAKLRETFEFPYEENREVEYKSWTSLSAALIYRDGEQLPPRKAKPKADVELGTDRKLGGG